MSNMRLGDGFYASLMQTDFETKNKYRVTVWLSHTDCEEKVYAFTMMLGVVCSVNDADVVNTVRVVKCFLRTIIIGRNKNDNNSGLSG